MRRFAFGILVLTLAVGLGSRPAEADPIAITGGHLLMGSSVGSLQLIGERGFTLSATVGVTDSNFQPWVQCVVGCAPGTPISLTAVFVGLSLHAATATLDGQTFTGVGGLTSPHSAVAAFSGSVLAPPLDGDTATIVAPFLFEGLFASSAFVQPDGTGSIRESLVGLGTVTLSLQRTLGGDTGFPAQWRYTAAAYEFDPIPEPATLLLTGAGTLWLVRRRVRRQNGALRPGARS